MELADWALRSFYGLLLANLFIGGLYFFLRGYLTYYTFKKYWYKSVGKLRKVGKGLRAVIEWERMGETFSSIKSGIFSLRNNERVEIFVKDFRCDLNNWTRNGKGLMILGVILISLALLGFFLLLR